jgi:hypothetical protein
MSNEFSPTIKQFISDQFDSVAELELLLLLRTDPSRTWTAQEAGAALYANPDAVSLLMDALKSKRLLETEGSEQRFFFRPESDELFRLIDELADLYRERRVAVITLIYSKPIDKIRSFADSFRLRKDK